MKTLASFILIVALLQTEAKPKQESRFHCDVPDEWLFPNNDTGTLNIWPGERWPGAVVKYVLHSSLSDNDRVEVQKAFDDIQSKTCIRFQPRASGEAAYVSIEFDDTVCGIGHLCRTGGYQYAKFGGGCRDSNTMVHELGHNLCLGHEMSRKDRDSYVNFPGCSPNEIPGKDTNSDLRGSLYDYGSQMHYQCGWCLGGWPTEAGASKCGRDIQTGLSVLDTDKLNDLYDCGDCMAHRWKPIDALTEEDRQNMLPFGETGSGEPLYACRGNINGQIAIGKYAAQAGVCYLPYGDTEYERRSRAQVFTWPSSRVTLDSELKPPTYKPANVTSLTREDVVIPSGRTADGVTGFIAVATIESEGRREECIGEVFDNDWNTAYFPFFGKVVRATTFGVIVCG